MNEMKPELKTLVTIHTALLGAQLLFGAIVYITNKKQLIELDENFRSIFQIVTIALSVLLVAASFILFNKKIRLIRETNDALNEKISQYKIVSIIKFSLIEAPCLLSIIGYYFTNDIFFFVLAGALIILFAAQRPTPALVSHHLLVDKDDLT